MSSLVLAWRIVGVVIILFMQSVTATDCACELAGGGKPFPKDKLLSIETSAIKCNENIQLAKVSEEASLRLGLHKRLLQLQDEVSVLEQEDDGGLYGAVSLRIIEMELAEILQLINRLNTTHNMHRSLGANVHGTMQQVQAELKSLEEFDHMQIAQKLEENKRLQRSLAQCQEELQATPPPPTPPPSNCPHGPLIRVDGPRTYTITQYGTSYHYGSWGRDPKPARGKEGWYWLIPLTSSNVYANYVRQYNSLSALVAGVGPVDVSIASANPTTNTIQGPNVVMYGDALYYGCYNSPTVCRFNLTSRQVTTVALPANSGINNKFPFCHLGACYVYTDLDLMTDDSGVWVAYTSAENFGDVMLNQVESGDVPRLGRTLKTSLHKRTATNTFMACGVLYATRYVDKETEEVFYSFDSRTGVERHNLNIRFKKMQTNIHSLNYDPSDHKLYAYSDAYAVSYDAIFE
ncbi:olfactomedin-4-like [Engraulis encrasicolus]|uniref:olfactomedin-4-like n=1 Tax=Engraulis encrasicolus TaxID=184585 RepID=UPI002FD01032